MRSSLVWLFVVVLAAMTGWQLFAAQPVISPLAAGILLFFLGLVAGVRLGTDSMGRFVKEHGTLNKYLAEQNRDLAEMNLFLLNCTSYRGRTSPASPGGETDVETHQTC